MDTVSIMVSGLFIGLFAGISITLLVWWVKKRLLARKINKHFKKEEEDAKEETIREIKEGISGGGKTNGSPRITEESIEPERREQSVEPEVSVDERDGVSLPEPDNEATSEQQLGDSREAIELYRPDPL